MIKKNSSQIVYPKTDLDGTKRWYDENGKSHRDDGPAIEHAIGNKYWYQHGKFHREDGPAIECANGFKAWYQNDRYHREDGPAIEWSNGHEQWWYEGKQLPPYVQSVEQLKSYIRNKILW